MFDKKLIALLHVLPSLTLIIVFFGEMFFS